MAMSPSSPLRKSARILRLCPKNLLSGLGWNLLFIPRGTFEQQVRGMENTIFAQSPLDDGLRFGFHQVRLRADVNYRQARSGRVGDGFGQNLSQPAVRVNLFQIVGDVGNGEAQGQRLG